MVHVALADRGIELFGEEFGKLVERSILMG
jgi:hypothetical protein